MQVGQSFLFPNIHKFLVNMQHIYSPVIFYIIHKSSFSISIVFLFIYCKWLWCQHLCWLYPWVMCTFCSYYKLNITLHGWSWLHGYYLYFDMFFESYYFIHLITISILQSFKNEIEENENYTQCSSCVHFSRNTSEEIGGFIDK